MHSELHNVLYYISALQGNYASENIPAISSRGGSTLRLQKIEFPFKGNSIIMLEDRIRQGDPEALTLFAETIGTQVKSLNLIHMFGI